MSDTYVFSPPAPVAIPVLGGGSFPVRRIFCIGRNYVNHVREMGGDPRSDPPVFFCKPADAVVSDGADAPYPSGTENLHFEGELVVAIKQGGTQLSSRGEAGALIYGHACGCDLTRRDLQSAAKREGGPWDAAKGFDASAPIGTLASLADVSPDILGEAQLVTSVNGEERQNAPLSSMIWNVPEIIIAISQLFRLQPGDLIFTGTPEGVGPVQSGDEVQVSIGPLPALRFRVG